MGNPILIVKDAGRGVTPVPADALLQPGADLVINQQADDGTYVKESIKVVAVVPQGVHIDYAIADQTDQPRPLMIREDGENNFGQTIYVLKREDGSEIIVTQATMRRGIDMAEEAGLNKDA